MQTCAPDSRCVASLAVAALLVMVEHANAHGAVTIPKPRNAIDGDQAPWAGKVPWPIPFDNPNWCAHPSADMAGKDPHNLTGSNGQACFWFSNGCDIGSGTCDGDTGQILDRNHFIYVGNGTVPSWGKEGIVPDPKLKGKSAGYHYREPAFRPKNLKYPERNATLPCELRTLNTGSECGGPEDFWYYAPWRSPGSAPVRQLRCGAVCGGYHDCVLAPVASEGVQIDDFFSRVGDRFVRCRRRPSSTHRRGIGRRHICQHHAREAGRQRKRAQARFIWYGMDCWLCGRGGVDAEGLAWGWISVQARTCIGAADRGDLYENASSVRR